MLAFDVEEIERLVSECRLTEAAAALDASRFQDAADAPELRCLRPAVHAITGDDRSLAASANPHLIACRAEAEVTEFFDAAGGAQPLENLVAGIVLTWAADSNAAYDFLRRAHDRALSERRPHFAVAAMERLSHHAMLFGDVETARTAIDDAVRLASIYRLQPWLLRSLSAAARLALDTGDLALSGQLVERASAQARSAETFALFAPIGAQLAVEGGDDAALDTWTGAKIVETALGSPSEEASIAATMALLIAAGAGRDVPVRVALRRALHRAKGAAVAPELFSLAARHGDLDDARLATRALAAVPAPQRRYLRAHRLLARAHLSFRSSRHAQWANYASDAARAFNALGLRRWTNEAMLLLVRHASGGARYPAHGRSPSATLTEREQQVADLIRRGARNREVASALQISEHTVERHVSSILGRLGLRSRWQIETRNSAQD